MLTASKSNSCPSVFGRLVALAESRNEATRQIHKEVFSDWLGFRLQQQERDLSVWLEWLASNPEASSELPTLEKLGQQRWHETLLPPGAIDPERELFLSDLNLVLTLLSAPGIRHE
jgi:hypothetical protein